MTRVVSGPGENPADNPRTTPAVRKMSMSRFWSDGLASGYEIHRIVRRKSEILEQSRPSVESHVFAKIRPIELEYPPDQLDLAFEHSTDRGRVNFHVKNVFSRNDKSPEQHPTP